MHRGVCIIKEGRVEACITAWVRFEHPQQVDPKTSQTCKALWLSGLAYNIPTCTQMSSTDTRLSRCMGACVEWVCAMHLVASHQVFHVID